MRKFVGSTVNLTINLNNKIGNKSWDKFMLVQEGVWVMSVLIRSVGHILIVGRSVEISQGSWKILEFIFHGKMRFQGSPIDKHFPVFGKLEKKW